MNSMVIDSRVGPIRARLPAVASLILFVLFLGYCKVYALVSGEPVSSTTATKWGASATIAWGGLTSIIIVQRKRLREAMMRGSADKVAVFLTLLIAVLLADQLSWLLMERMGARTGGEFGRRVYFFAPRAVMIASIIFLAVEVWIRRTHPSSASRTQQANPEWLSIPEAPELRVRIRDIASIRSAGNYSEVIANGRAHLVRVTLTDLTSRLEPLGFMRVHRQHIVNVERVRNVVRGADRRVIIGLDNDAVAPVGRHYTDAVNARFDRIAIKV